MKHFDKELNRHSSFSPVISTFYIDSRQNIEGVAANISV